ncbi:MAG: hypothetical protein VX899_18055 [Myxococcota bacterium]|nr:hypothetical protein [Myxococcota bacterium]
MAAARQDDKAQQPRGNQGRRTRKRVGLRERLWMAASKVLGKLGSPAHKTNASGNNMSQR